jgi:hypothetical protein
MDAGDGVDDAVTVEYVLRRWSAGCLFPATATPAPTRRLSSSPRAEDNTDVTSSIVVNDRRVWRRSRTDASASAAGDGPEVRLWAEAVGGQLHKS